MIAGTKRDFVLARGDILARDDITVTLGAGNFSPTLLAFPSRQSAIALTTLTKRPRVIKRRRRRFHIVKNTPETVANVVMMLWWS
jgi:hypothetical protein